MASVEVSTSPYNSTSASTWHTGVPIGEYVPPFAPLPPLGWPGSMSLSPIIQPGCDHCYCQEAVGQWIYAGDGTMILAEDHMSCCKCMDKRHKQFLSGGSNDGQV